MVGDDLPGRTVIGCNNTIGHHAVVGVKCQDMKYKVIFCNNYIDLTTLTLYELLVNIATPPNHVYSVH